MVLGGSDDPPEPELSAEERLRVASEKLEARRRERPTHVYFRTPRGGHVPLDPQSQRELLRLYSGFGISVADIGEHFGVGTGTIYRWLILLGVQSQDRATPDELRRLAEARELARKARQKKK